MSALFFGVFKCGLFGANNFSRACKACGSLAFAYRISTRQRSPGFCESSRSRDAVSSAAHVRSALSVWFRIPGGPRGYHIPLPRQEMAVSHVVYVSVYRWSSVAHNGCPRGSPVNPHKLACLYHEIGLALCFATGVTRFGLKLFVHLAFTKAPGFVSEICKSFCYFSFKLIACF